jgi:isopenicillin-N epimerase
MAISHGANDPRADRSRFRLEADWTGTADPSAYLSLPAAIRFGEMLSAGGWPELMRANHELAVTARDRLVSALGIDPPVPDTLLGAMAAIPLPGPAWPPDADPLADRLFERHRIEVPIGGFPVSAARGHAAPAHARLLRISAAAYNRPEQYDRLAAALSEELEREAGRGPSRGG